MGDGSAPAGAHHGRRLTPAPVAAPALTLSQQRIELTTGDSVELVVELESDEQADRRHLGRVAEQRSGGRDGVARWVRDSGGAGAGGDRVRVAWAARGVCRAGVGGGGGEYARSRSAGASGSRGGEVGRGMEPARCDRRGDALTRMTSPVEPGGGSSRMGQLAVAGWHVARGGVVSVAVHPRRRGRDTPAVRH